MTDVRRTRDSASPRPAPRVVCAAAVVWVVVATAAYLVQFADVVPAILRLFWKA